MAVASADNKMTLWDFSVEVDESEKPDEDIGMDIPPQMMFLHQGQSNMKELRFHPQYATLIVTTAEDSFNVLRPNLDPLEETTEQQVIGQNPGAEQAKHGESTNEESK